MLQVFDLAGQTKDRACSQQGAQAAHDTCTYPCTSSSEPPWKEDRQLCRDVLVLSWLGEHQHAASTAWPHSRTALPTLPDLRGLAPLIYFETRHEDRLKCYN